jgi:hypothetical protein
MTVRITVNETGLVAMLPGPQHHPVVLVRHALLLSACLPTGRSLRPLGTRRLREPATEGVWRELLYEQYRVCSDGCYKGVATAQLVKFLGRIDALLEF